MTIMPQKICVGCTRTNTMFKTDFYTLHSFYTLDQTE